MALIAPNTPMDKLFLNRYGQCFFQVVEISPLGEACGGVEQFHTTKGSSAASLSSLPEEALWLCQAACTGQFLCTGIPAQQ